MQLKVVLTILASLAPLVLSTSVGDKSCDNHQFLWKPKDCCLPKGGPPNPPSPPKDSDCPPTTHYWGSKQSCCVPRNPPPQNHPPPECRKGWTWYPAVHRCHKTPSPPQPPPSNPSPKPGDRYHNDKKRRSLKARTSPCPNNLDACPVSGPGGDYECLDTTTELESCGGCTSLKQGQDCTKIEGAWNVGCNQGSCVVYTCAGGYRIGADGKSCVPY